jgi:hypothetical protein
MLDVRLNTKERKHEVRIKVFTFQKPCFSMWRIPAGKMETEIENWLLKNPGINVREIKHDSFQGIWYAPQLVVSVYYADANES